MNCAYERERFQTQILLQHQFSTPITCHLFRFQLISQCTPTLDSDLSRRAFLLLCWIFAFHIESQRPARLHGSLGLSVSNDYKVTYLNNTMLAIQLRSLFRIPASQKSAPVFGCDCLFSCLFTFCRFFYTSVDDFSFNNFFSV